MLPLLLLHIYTQSPSIPRLPLPQRLACDPLRHVHLGRVALGRERVWELRFREGLEMCAVVLVGLRLVSHFARGASW
jgi:hypothetical protein